MADFENAIEVIYEHTPGYDDGRNQYSGESYRGIGRKWHGEWSGWEIIDNLKERNSQFVPLLDEHQVLQVKVKKFYKNKFWNHFWGDQLPSQHIANVLLDISVLLGVGKAVLLLQKALNALNKDGHKWHNLSLDKRYGPMTHKAVMACCENEGDITLLLRAITVLEGNHVIYRGQKYTNQDTFVRFWLSRTVCGREFQVAV